MAVSLLMALAVPAMAAGAAASMAEARSASAVSTPHARSTSPVKQAEVKRKAAHAVPRRGSGKVAVPPPDPIPAAGPVRSDAAARVIAWIAASRDNGPLPYAVIDKTEAMLFLFDPAGRAVGQVPVLIGVGVGDDSSPGIGAKDLADIGPAERTTPAGRFVAKFGRAFGKQRVLWVDYADSVALHAVITTHKRERRIERLASPTPDDNRITFGCINVAARFYADTLGPLFRRRGGVVYILPDTRPLDEVFPRLRLLPYLGTSAAPAGDGRPDRETAS